MSNVKTTAFGAAALAGLGVGLWRSEEELASLWSLERRFEPRMQAHESAARRARWAQALERSLHWAREP